MKELSIEEKARRYDEALEIAKKINNEQRAQPFYVMTRVFPELKESGDVDSDINVEKQGKQKAKYHDICDTCVRQPTCQSDCFLQQSEQKQEVEGNPNARKPTLRIIKGKSYLCIKDYRDKNCTFTKGKIYESDKDGFLVDDEEKDTFERKIWEEDAIEYFFLFEQSKPKNIVTDKKQKPSTKAEPKFHKGEWLCENEPNNYARFIQILETVNVQGKERCRISRDIHNDEDTVEFDFVEKYYHKFDIRDAKDGDVLCTYECAEPKIVFILKGTPKKHYALSYHCYYNIMYPHFGSDSEKGCLAPDDEDVKPATKGQRDLLFQKMREAGYEWDAEKKELKNVVIMETKFKTVTEIEVPIELVDNNVETFASIVKEMTELYARKNHDYGNSFDEGCDKIGTGYPLGRLLDKMNRLIACMGKEDTMQVNESIEDTLTDLACYSVMTLSYLKRKNNK